MALNRGAPPTSYHAGVYSSVEAYLEAVAASGSTDGATVVAQMKRMGFHDDAFGDVMVRADGRAIHTMYVFQVKPPAESKDAGDVFTKLSEQPGDQAFRPIGEGGCKLDQMGR